MGAAARLNAAGGKAKGKRQKEGPGGFCLFTFDSCLVFRSWSWAMAAIQLAKHADFGDFSARDQVLNVQVLTA